MIHILWKRKILIICLFLLKICPSSDKLPNNREHSIVLSNCCRGQLIIWKGYKMSGTTKTLKDRLQANIINHNEAELRTMSDMQASYDVQMIEDYSTEYHPRPHFMRFQRDDSTFDGDWITPQNFDSAVYCGEYKMIYHYLKEHPEAATTPNQEGYLPLAFVRDPDMLQLLIDAGADVNAVDQYGNTALHYASSIGMTKALVAAGAYVTDPRLLHAARTPEQTRYYIEAGLDVNYVAKNGKTALHYAHDAKQTIMLITAGADVNVADANGETPLHVAKSPETAMSLIDADANVNAQDNKGQTPLHKMMKMGYSEQYARMMIKAGADVNLVDYKGRTALHETYDARTARLLVGAGADIDAKDNVGQTPLFNADLDKMQFLIDAGANVNAADNFGKTALHYVTGDSCVQLLAKSGADMNAQDVRGQTALFSANYGTAQALIKNGADATILDKEGNTALMALLKGKERPNHWLIDYLSKQDYSGLPREIRAEQDRLLRQYNQESRHPIYMTSIDSYEAQSGEQTMMNTLQQNASTVDAEQDQLAVNQSNNGRLNA